MHTKDFDSWNTLKQRLNSKEDKSVPWIKEREIWWCSVGINIGHEADGHNELYNLTCLFSAFLSPRRNMKAAEWLAPISNYIVQQDNANCKPFNLLNAILPWLTKKFPYGISMAVL